MIKTSVSEGSSDIEQFKPSLVSMFVILRLSIRYDKQQYSVFVDIHFTTDSLRLGGYSFVTSLRFENGADLVVSNDGIT